MSTSIRRLLVANRGEIAVRVIRSARDLGIEAVAVFSDADAGARHVALADHAVHLGPAEAARSYLDAMAVLEAARASGADAVHPGYGFLSERADFAEAVLRAGLVWVGPPPTAIRALGDKISAKKIAEQAGVPIAPGLFDPSASEQDLAEGAARIGYPVMLKASAGGGGRGMRVVRKQEEFLDALRTASDEAMKAFGDGTMMVERYVERPRHIEVQLLADHHGKIAALFERDCTMQRRHQKLVEESPAPGLTERQWAVLRQASVALAQEAGYQNAGTVEFMLDSDTGDLFFLEVNARLQVEHPVTELVTGVDLVALQLQIAQGLRLDDLLPEALLRGDRAALRGCSIEARIVAEDPARGFLPGSGKLNGWAEPAGPFVRVDSGFGPGLVVPPNYDSLLAKLIVHGRTRAEAIDRLIGALKDFHVLGVPTNIAFLLDAIGHQDFDEAAITTKWVEQVMADWRQNQAIPGELGLLAQAATTASAQNRSKSPQVWDAGDSWRNVER